MKNVCDVTACAVKPGKDDRVVLESVCVRDGFAVCTNGKSMLAVAVDSEDEDAASELLMSAAAVRMAVKAGAEFAGAWKVTPAKEDAENPGVLVKHDFFRRTEFDGTDQGSFSRFPAWEKCVPAMPVRKVVVTFDVKQLAKMAAAMGADDVSLVLDADAFDAEGVCEIGGPIVVLNKACPAVVGVLMPMRDGAQDSEGWKLARELE